MKLEEIKVKGNHEKRSGGFKKEVRRFQKRGQEVSKKRSGGKTGMWGHGLAQNT